MSGQCHILPSTPTTPRDPERRLTLTGYTSLPPIKSEGYLGSPYFTIYMATAVGEDPISVWLKQGEVDKLEQAVLDGYGEHLNGKTSRLPQVNRFLRQIPNFQAKIEEIHRAVTLGKLRAVQHLIDHKKLAFCRDQMGATPLHKAIIYGQTEILQFLLDQYPSVIHARDHRGRTPLHYSAVLPDGGDIYKMLTEAGADEKATDMFGKSPEDYLNNEEGISVQVLREGAIVSKPFGRRRSRKSACRMIDPQSWSKIHTSKSLWHKSNIRELIKQGNLTTLEEIVIQGYGDRLIGESSTAPLVEDFLTRVPALIEQITEVHKTAMKGNLRNFQGLLEHKGVILSRDQIGATPLHKAVLYGHQDLVQYIVSNYPVALDTRDHDGRTPLHYAAALEDDRLLYNLLVKAGASPLLPDYKGKSADYYLRHPDQISIHQIMKRSQRLNANYAINTANRIKSKSPSRRRGWSPSNRKSDPGGFGTGQSSRSDPGVLSDHEDGSSNEGSTCSGSNNPFSKPSLRSLPASSLQRMEVTSANLKRWFEEEDLESLEGAILEGHGDRVKLKAEVLSSLDIPADKLQNYVSETLPKIMNKIRAIHAAVSCGDVTCLQENLDKKDYALAKDHLGMAPLHKAVILGHLDVVQFILEKFPETINAKDREARTALHYAAATTNRNGARIYKMLVRAGADARIRDINGKTAEYYRVHLLPLPNELSRLSVNSKRKGQYLDGLSPLLRRRPMFLPSIQEKITTALHDGDAHQLNELVLEGYGDAILGRSSWGEEARRFLRGLPHLLDNIKTLHASIVNGDLDGVQRILSQDSTLVRAKDENGLMAFHLATYYNQTEIVDFIQRNYAGTASLRDHFGRTALHIAAQNKSVDLYRMLVASGADPKAFDLRGKTAEHYIRMQVAGESYLQKFTGNSYKSDGDSMSRSSKATPSSPSAKTEADSLQELDVVEPDAEAIPEPPLEPATIAEVKPEAEPTPQPEPEVEPEAVLEPEAEPEAVPEPEAEPEAKLEAEPEPEAEPELEHEADSEVEHQPEPETGPEAGPEAEAEPVTEAEVQLEHESEPNTSTETRVKPHEDETQTAPEAETELEPGAELQADEALAGDVEAEAALEHIESLDEAVLKEEQKTDAKEDQTEGGTEVKAEEVSEQVNEENADPVPQEAENEEPVAAKEEKQTKGALKRQKSPMRRRRMEAKMPLKAKQAPLPRVAQTKAKKSKPVELLPVKATEKRLPEKKLSRNASLPNVQEKKKGLRKRKSDSTKNLDQVNEVHLEAPLEPMEAESNDKQSMAGSGADLVATQLVASSSLDALSIIQGTMPPANEMNGVESRGPTKTYKAEEEPEQPTEPKGESSHSETLGAEEVLQEASIEAAGEDLETHPEAAQRHDTQIYEQKVEAESEAEGEAQPKADPEVAEEAPKDPEIGLESAPEADEEQANDESAAQDVEVKPVTEPLEDVPQNNVEDTGKEGEAMDGHEDTAEVAAPIEGAEQGVGQGAEQAEEAQTETDNNNIEGEGEAVTDATQEGGQLTASVEEDKVTVEGNPPQDTPVIAEEPADDADPEHPLEHIETDHKVPGKASADLVAEEVDGTNNGDLEKNGDITATEVSGNEVAADEQPAEVTENAEHERKSSSTSIKSVVSVKSKKSDSDKVENEEEVAPNVETVEAEEAANGEKETAESKDENLEERTQLDEEGEVSKEMPQEGEVKPEGDTGRVTETEKDGEDAPEAETISAPAAESPAPVEEDGKQSVEPEAAVEPTAEEVTRGRTSTKTSAGSVGRASISTTTSDDRLNDLIEQWLKDGDLLRLEVSVLSKLRIECKKLMDQQHVVIAGQGERLIGKKSIGTKNVEEFLELVPAYMAKIKSVHEAVVRGNFNEVRQVLTRKRFALSRDHLGASPLHLAVLHGHMDVLVYIVTQFPETIDGPDNEGRSPLHYAAVVGDEDNQYYEILKKAGANEKLTDKSGHIPSYYLTETGELTIRNLLENYKQEPEIGTKDSEAVDVWQRPSTADIESRLTPSPDGSVGSQGEKAKNGHKQEVSADVHVDAENKEEEHKEEEQQDNQAIETMSTQFQEALKQEKDRLQETTDRMMETAPSRGPESLDDEEGSTSSTLEAPSYELCQVKDENGQTILHLAAAKPQKPSTLYKMLSQASYLIPERDAKYRTIRDIAVDGGLTPNVQVIDKFVLDEFVKRNVGFVQMLSHEGYDIINVVDEEGQDVTSLLLRKNVTSMINLLHDITYFQKSKEELHTFIKNDYTQGVMGLVDSDPALISAKNKRGRCALHIGVLFGNLEIIDSLVKNNPSAVNAQDNLGRTPLHYGMATNKVEEIGKLLIQAGANRQIRDVKMRTPSYYFVYNEEIREIKKEEQALS